MLWTSWDVLPLALEEQVKNTTQRKQVWERAGSLRRNPAVSAQGGASADEDGDAGGLAPVGLCVLGRLVPGSCTDGVQTEDRSRPRSSVREVQLHTSFVSSIAAHGH